MGDHMTYQAKVFVTLKPGVNDPQGVTIGRALGRLGFSSVKGVRTGKYFEIQIDARDRPSAELQVREMCERLLANLVIERYSFEVAEYAAPSRA
jgi:phosphoribosylformylglycinamidine synthase